MHFAGADCCQPVRGEIPVENRCRDGKPRQRVTSSPCRQQDEPDAEDAAPDGAWNLFPPGFCKDFTPRGVEKRHQALFLTCDAKCMTRSQLGMAQKIFKTRGTRTSCPSDVNDEEWEFCAGRDSGEPQSDPDLRFAGAGLGWLARPPAPAIPFRLLARHRGAQQ